MSETADLQSAAVANAARYPCPFHKASRARLAPGLAMHFSERALWNGTGRGVRTLVSAVKACALPIELFPSGATHTGIPREGGIPIQAALINLSEFSKNMRLVRVVREAASKLRGLDCVGSAWG